MNKNVKPHKVQLATGIFIKREFLLNVALEEECALKECSHMSLISVEFQQEFTTNLISVIRIRKTIYLLSHHV